MKPQKSYENNHTPQITTRRRALFPSATPPLTTGDADDLGCISPLDFESQSSLHFLSTDHRHKYDIIGPVEQGGDTPKNTRIGDISTPSSTVGVESPSLRTPHDLSISSINNSATAIPKIIRNINKSSFNSNNSSKRVRTALFPDLDNMVLPTKTFYSSPLQNPPIKAKVAPVLPGDGKRNGKKSNALFLCGRISKRKRGATRKRVMGQINAGVRHGIRKPKARKNYQKNNDFLQTALDIIDNSPLNEFFNLNKENTEINSNNLELFPKNQIQHKPIAAPLVNNNDHNSLNNNNNNNQEETQSAPDATKKFFKSSTSHPKAVVTVNDQIKLQFDNTGHMSLVEKNCRSRVKRPLTSSPATTKSSVAKRIKLGDDDFNEVGDDLNHSIPDLTNIITLLGPDDKENKTQANDTPPKSVDINEIADVLMSPTSQMCNMASGLALNSPKDTELNNPKRLYPVFYPQTQSQGDVKSGSGRGALIGGDAALKKFRATSKNQMLLDAGQKKWGATRCFECDFMYHQGDPGDEALHQNYHYAVNKFRFGGWKNERLVFEDAPHARRIIQIVPGDPKIWWKRAKEVLDVVNRDLGFFDYEFAPSSSQQVFLYIKNRVIVGILAAEVRDKAFKLLTGPEDQADLCSEESYPVRCGVTRIWVSRGSRREGVASAMMDALKRNFVFGAVLTGDQVAVSSPTQNGKLFGAAYFKTKHFLIY